MLSELFQYVQKLRNTGLDLLFPQRCASCQRVGHLLCPACLQTMQPSASPFCVKCGISLPVPNTGCPACQQRPLQLHGLRCTSYYQASLRTAVHELKYSGQQRLAEPLGLLLAQTFRHYKMHADALVPLPLYPQRQQDRGYNQATLLARACATHLKVPCLEHLVLRQRDTHTQVGLSARERQQNVAGAFACPSGAVRELAAYHTLVLIDDVSTTGASLEACAAPLYAAGIKEMWGLVLARPNNMIQDVSKVML